MIRIDCGMLHFVNKDLHDKVKKDLGVNIESIDYNTFTEYVALCYGRL